MFAGERPPGAHTRNCLMCTPRSARTLADRCSGSGLRKAASRRRTPCPAVVRALDASTSVSRATRLVIDPRTSSQSSAYGKGLSLLIPVGQEPRPLLHQDAPALEQVRASVGCLHLVADHVRQRRLHHCMGRVRTLGRPVSKAGTEAVAISWISKRDWTGSAGRGQDWLMAHLARALSRNRPGQ